MTDTKTNEDLRETLFEKYSESIELHSGDYENMVSADNAKLMLDEYWEKRAKELLEWMADNDVECGKYEDTGEPCFKYKGGWIEKDTLFESFL